jgi:hypothetical protein
LFQSKFENKEKLQENDERDVAKLCLDLPSNGVFVAVVGFFDRGNFSLSFSLFLSFSFETKNEISQCEFRG